VTPFKRHLHGILIYSAKLMRRSSSRIFVGLLVIFFLASPLYAGEIHRNTKCPTDGPTPSSDSNIAMMSPPAWMAAFLNGVMCSQAYQGSRKSNTYCCWDCSGCMTHH